MAGQRGQPARIGGAAIIQERDDIALRDRQAGITRARQPRLEPVRGHHDVPRQQLGQHPGLRLQLRAVIDDQDDLIGRLRADRDHRLLQVIPPVQGRGADHHRHGQPQHRPLRRRRPRRIAPIRLPAPAGTGPDQSHRRERQTPAGRPHPQR